MKIAFIACEYNPFHNGHMYQIQQTKKNGADAVICIMSGNFVQRGEAAVADKFLRAETALINGADLVLELPLKYATADASHFAEGFVKTIDATGLNGFISFGSGTDADTLKEIREVIFSEKAESYASVMQRNGINYPTAKALYLKEEKGEAFSRILDDANNILALEYIDKACKYLKKPVFYSVRRQGSLHDSEVPYQEFASAGYIRNKIYESYNDDYSNNGIYSCRRYISDKTLDIYNKSFSSGAFPVEREKCDLCIFSKLLSLSDEYFLKINNVNGGLENRITEKIRNSASLEDLYDAVKTKRYTHSRIRQILLQAALGITKDDIESGISYIRVLGFNKIGREILADMRKSSKVPVITNLSAADKSFGNTLRDAEADYLAGKLHNICRPVPLNGNTEYSSRPVIID